MAQINKYKIDWINDDDSIIPNNQDGPDWSDIWKEGRKDTIFAEAKDAFKFMQTMDEFTDYINEDEWNKENFYYRENADGTPAIEWFNGMTRTDARLLAETFDDDYDWAVKQSQISGSKATVNNLLRMGVSMFADETNLIPFGIGVNGFKALAKAPKLYKNIMAGAATTAAYSTAEQFLIYPQAEWNRRRREVELTEQLQNIGLATIVGGVFGGAGSKVNDYFTNRAIKKEQLRKKENDEISQTKNAYEKSLNDATDDVDVDTTDLEFDRIDSAPDDLENISLGPDNVGSDTVLKFNDKGQLYYDENPGVFFYGTKNTVLDGADDWWKRKAQSRSQERFEQLDKRLQQDKKAIDQKIMLEVRRGKDGILEFRVQRKEKTQTILQSVVDRLREDKIRIIFGFNKQKPQVFEFGRLQILDNLTEVLRQMGLTKLSERNPIQPTVKLYKGTDGTQILVYENRYDGGKNIVLQNADGTFKNSDVLTRSESHIALRLIEEKKFAQLQKFLKARKQEQNTQLDDVNTAGEEIPEFEVVNENIVVTKQAHDKKINKIIDEANIDALDNLGQSSGVKNADMDAIKKGETVRQPNTNEKRANPDAVETDLTQIKQVQDNLNVQKNTMQKLKDRLPKYIACKIKNIAKWR